ncbi:hypothetical protein GCM10023097_30440 [Streptomyces collinus]
MNGSRDTLTGRRVAEAVVGLVQPHDRAGPGQGTFWGHGGTVWGGGALAMTRADGKRQLAVAVNLQRWNRLDSAGKPQPHPIDDALTGVVPRGDVRLILMCEPVPCSRWPKERR